MNTLGQQNELNKERTNRKDVGGNNKMFLSNKNK